METTFILAGSFGVTPFEIMKQDVDEVIMIINYLSESGVVCFKRLIHHDMSKSLKTYKATKQKGDPHEQTENNRPV
ncbi:MAG: hypothetical protein ACLRXK_00990 [Acutalibacteraceae bacterium]